MVTVLSLPKREFNHFILLDYLIPVFKVIPLIYYPFLEQY